tara:strand:- start:7834 stop:8349 length:516 start_codon:yes stop_codon:yes gene_type:complete
MADKPKDIIKKKPALNWTNHTAKDAITLEDGTKIDAEVVVPDGAIGYGDNESAALMAADVVLEATEDAEQGQAAYESSREQLDADQVEKLRFIARQREVSKNPVMEAFEDRDAAGVLRGYHVLTNYYQPTPGWAKSWRDPETGLVTYPRLDFVPIDEGDRVYLSQELGITV